MTKQGRLFLFYGCHALGERRGSKGHGLPALATRTHHLFIPPLIETLCTTSELCFGQIKVTILISYPSLQARHPCAHKSSCLPPSSWTYITRPAVYHRS